MSRWEVLFINNTDIRTMARRKGVYLWQIADALGMADSAFSRKLRKELPNEQKAQILSVIDRLALEVR